MTVEAGGPVPGMAFHWLLPLVCLVLAGVIGSGPASRGRKARRAVRERPRPLAGTAPEAQLARQLAEAHLILWSVDRQARLSFVAGAALGSRAAGELVGQTATALFPDASAFGEDVRRALAGESLTTQVESDGRVFSTCLSPHHDADGELDGAGGLSIDVTARVVAEREQARLQDALRRAAEEWRTTFDAIDSPVLVLEPDDTVRRVNRATRALWDEPFEAIVGARLPHQRPGLPWAAIARAAAQCRERRSAVTLQAHDEATEKLLGRHRQLPGCGYTGRRRRDRPGPRRLARRRVA